MLTAMDTRTAAALCMTDLAPLIEAGDFRKLGAAEHVIEELASSAAGDQDRAAALYQLGDDLSLVEASQPEADAFLRAIRASVRRRMYLVFERTKARGMLSGKRESTR